MLCLEVNIAIYFLKSIVIYFFIKLILYVKFAARYLSITHTIRISAYCTTNRVYSVVILHGWFGNTADRAWITPCLSSAAISRYNTSFRRLKSRDA